jgi:hypothetical protein
MDLPAGTACLAKALALCPYDETRTSTKIADIAAWLLRLASGDAREGWESKSFARGPKIDYWEIKPVATPGDWIGTPEGHAALAAITDKDDFWRIQTNLLGLFGLPKDRQALRHFLAV